MNFLHKELYHKYIRVSGVVSIFSLYLQVFALPGINFLLDKSVETFRNYFKSMLRTLESGVLERLEYIISTVSVIKSSQCEAAKQHSDSFLIMK